MKVLHILLIMLIMFVFASVAIVVAIAWTHYPHGIPIRKELKRLNENRRHQQVARRR